ncbi:MAG: FUSC family protein [Betaproteobacteria bacterium]|nr:FUSC family protein [Betaproteobacteria bacterium]
MTTLVPTLEAALPPQRSWLERLRSEFAPTPGRFNATLRIVVATTIVLVTSITLEVPSIALSLFIVLFLTKLTSVVTTQNSVFAAIAGALAIIVVTLAIALTVLILRLTIDHPPLRLAAMAAVFFLGMFAARVFVLGPAGFLVAIVVLVSQAYVDLFPGPEPIVRAVLRVWVAVVYPAAITIGVNLLLLPADPEPLLRREAADRLRAVARLAGSPHGSAAATRAAAALAAWATTGPAPLLKLVRFADIRESRLRPLREERTAKVLLLQRLIESAALLPDLTQTLATGERARLEAVAMSCDELAAAVESGARMLPVELTEAVPDVPPDSGLIPVLAEIERLVRELPLAERPADDQPAAERRLFAPDALTNPRHAQFALKVTLAAMFCYVAYTAIDWDGIHTCMITCAVVALGSAGATTHKATLRLVGCAIGALLALMAIVFLLPQMESIVPLALLVAAVTAPAAWVAMGSERTAYLGLQFAFAFYLAVLQGHAPTTDVTELRDRVVGIFFGVIVMAVVFNYVWPERAGAGMRRALADALRRMGEAGIGIGASPAQTKLQRSRAWRALDEAGRAAELYAFEPEAMTAAGVATGQRVRGLIELTRRALLAQAALLEHRAAATALVAGNNARAALGHDVAVALDAAAQAVERGARPRHLELRSALAAMRDSGDAFAGEIALSAMLVERIEILQRAAETIPADPEPRRTEHPRSRT